MPASGGVIDLDAYEQKMRDQEWTGPVLSFRGTKYQFGPDIGVPDLVKMEEGEGTSVGFLTSLVIPDQQEAFKAALLDEDNVVSSVVLKHLSEKITEAYTKRPT